MVNASLPLRIFHTCLTTPPNGREERPQWSSPTKTKVSRLRLLTAKATIFRQVLRKTLEFIWAPVQRAVFILWINGRNGRILTEMRSVQLARLEIGSYRRTASIHRTTPE